MFNYIHRLHWWIKSSICGLVSSFILSIGHFLPYFHRPDATKPNPDIEQYGDKDHHLDEPLVANDPPPGEVLSNGSTAIVTRIGDGLVLKSPRYSWWHLSTESKHDLVKDMKKSFRVEEQIFQILGVHPRIIQYVIQFIHGL